MALWSRRKLTIICTMTWFKFHKLWSCRILNSIEILSYLWQNFKVNSIGIDNFCLILTGIVAFSLDLDWSLHFFIFILDQCPRLLVAHAAFIHPRYSYGSFTPEFYQKFVILVCIVSQYLRTLKCSKTLLHVYKIFAF